jgi:hypothetical protein
MHISSGHASSPFHNTPPCGDRWLSLNTGMSQRLMLADGMGHGVDAHRVVTRLADQLTALCRDRRPLLELDDCVAVLHQMLQGQVDGGQAAVALVDISPHRKELAAVIVGNIQVHYFTPEMNLHFPSLHGMVGGRLPRQLHITRAPLSSASLLALFSDGLESAPASQYLSDLHARSTMHGLQLQAEAETLLQRFGRLSDDASCALLWTEEDVA